MKKTANQLALLIKDLDYEELQDSNYSVFKLYYLKSYKLYLHIVLISEVLNELPVLYFQKMSLDYMKHNKNLIHLWEDQILHNFQAIQDRFHSLVQNNDTIYARSCRIQRIDKNLYDVFIDQHHLMNSAKSKFKYGLFYQNELLSVMGISAGRWMTKEGQKRKSFEIIRYASKSNFTVVGGFTKFLKHIGDDLGVDEWMSYQDLDWAIKGIYQKNNFNFKNLSQPITYYIHKVSFKRYTSEQRGNLNEEQQLEFYKIHNAGSIKLVKRHE